MKRSRWFPWLLLLAGLTGCQDPLRSQTIQGLAGEYQALAAARFQDRSGTWEGPLTQGTETGTIAAGPSGPFLQVNAAQAEKDQPPKKQPKEVLTLPRELPGSDQAAFKLPKDKVEREKYLQGLYPALPPLDPEVVPAPGPEGHPLTLGDLQRLADQYNPAIRAAEAAVQAARGAVRQSLAYPNPTFAFEDDTAATGPAGYPGFYVDQVIKTANKLQLQGAAATMDLFNAQLALRRARSDAAYQVRTNYFAVLVAWENMRLSRVFAQFTDRIYAIQVNLLKGNEAAAYEPMQLRPLALQARFNLLQATNQYHASWRQLAAGLGLPDMPPSEVAGSADLPVPVYDYDRVLEVVLNRHTDVLTAQNNVHKARYQLKLAEVTPIPDVDVRVLVQKDYTTPPFLTVPSVSVAVPIPVWDQNRGAIYQAQGALAQALQNVPTSQNTLINTLADAFNRYRTNTQQVTIARQQLTDQVRVYKHIRDRFYGGAQDVLFGDVVTAQQTLAGYLTGYLTALGAQWLAVADVANLLQTQNLFEDVPLGGCPTGPTLAQQLAAELLEPPPAGAVVPAAARLATPVVAGEARANTCAEVRTDSGIHLQCPVMGAPLDQRQPGR
jgi:cobalt-zinc-cadmium efflux system outer membrane protein